MLPDNPSCIEVGQRVFLYPHTKTASTACYQQRAAQVHKDPAAHWPMVVVTFKDGTETKWELVHKDNIKLKTSAATTTRAEKKEGDGNQSDSRTSSKWARVRKLPGKPKPIDLADGEEQGMLF